MTSTLTKFAWASCLWLSAAAAAQVVDTSERVNLAKFQRATADSYWSNQRPEMAVDGVVGNARRWVSDPGTSHWLVIDFPLPLELASSQLFFGSDDQFPVADFALEARSANGAWTPIPGAARSGNTANDLTIVFPQSVTTDGIRFTSTDTTVRLKEIGLYGPNGGRGYPLGTDMTLNLGAQRAVVASSIFQQNYPKYAVDGFVDDNSRWLTSNTTGPHTLEVELAATAKVGSVHLYSGFGNPTQGTIFDFRIEWWDGAAWQLVPGASVLGNSSPARRVQFSQPVVTNRVRLVCPNVGFQRVRELVILPYNGGAGYPIGTSVSMSSRPEQSFATYHDDFYGLRFGSSSVGLVGGAARPRMGVRDDEAQGQQFQLLLDVGSENYRIRNRESGLSLAVAGASKAAGAAIVEAQFASLPHQLWRMERVGSSLFRFVNAWSGHAIEVEGGSVRVGAQLVQQPVSASLGQQWRVDSIEHYPKKGLGGWDGNSWSIGNKWLYNWGMGTGANLPRDTNFAPMQWGSFSWGSLPRRFAGWKRRGQQTFLMGFNEPDNSTQSNIPVARAVELWPRLEEANQPLVSPGFTHGTGSWAVNFMRQADAVGLRQEYVSVHMYTSPNADSWMGYLWGIHTRYGRPVWLTEFSNVDWSGNGTWTHEDNYTFLSELLYRMEGARWLKRYAIFIFTGSATSKRSNFYQTVNGSRVRTPIGDLYSAWDGDLDVHDDLQYHVHGRLSHRHLAAGTTTRPVSDTIFAKDGPVQWVLRDAGNGLKHIVSVVDGRLLASDGATVRLADFGTAGPDVEWRLVPDQHGWYFIDQPLRGDRLRLEGNGVVSLTSNRNAWNSTRFRFILPIAPVPPRIETMYGTACGSGILTLGANPTPGGQASFVFFGGDPSSPALLLLAGASASLPLDSLGMTGCFANVDLGPAFVGGIPVATNPSRTARVDLPIPPGFTGLAYAQFVFTEGALNRPGLGATRGLRVIVR